MVFLQVNEQGKGLTGQAIPGMYCPGENECTFCECDPAIDESCYEDEAECYLGGGCQMETLSGGTCPDGTAPGGGSCYADEGTACSEGCEAGEVGRCGGAGTCNCVPGVLKKFHCEGQNSQSCIEDDDCEEQTGVTCYASESACLDSVWCGGSGNGGGNADFCCDVTTGTCSDGWEASCPDGSVPSGENACSNSCGGGGGGNSGNNYLCDGSCTPSNCNLSDANCYAVSDECNTACGGGGRGNNAEFCCISSSCNSGYSGVSCPGGTQPMEQSTCNTTCSGGSSNNCGNVTAQCTTTTVGEGATCGPTAECCTSGGELGMSGTACGTGLTCATNGGVSGACESSGAVCGNGTEETGEECDNGPANSDSKENACRTDCRLFVCGDGTIDTEEECDAGSNNSEDPDASCRTNCEDAGCGDGVEDTGEECDDGNTVDTDNCKNNCTEPEAVCTRCGDECTDLPPETIDCDEPTPTINIECAFENNVCTKTLLPFCGDGTKEDPEECDYGAANNTEFSIATDGCAFDCTAVQGLCTGDSDCAQAPGEDFLCLGPVSEDTEIVHYKKNEGDPDNIIYTVLAGECYYEAAGCEKDACIMHKIFSCDCPQVEEAIICGDGDKEGDEECDDGNANNNDGCTSDCILVVCGDGIMEFNTNEDCDDGNLIDGDGCSSSCLVEEAVEENLCGNGQFDAGEECDGDYRSSTCQPRDTCNDSCECEWGDVNVCGNDAAVCCAQGSTKRCCQQIADTSNDATLCWPVGQEPPRAACDAIDPAFACSACLDESTCRASESCVDGTCTLMDITTWQSGEDPTPSVFGSTIGHSVVVFNSRLWNVFQERDVIFSSNNVASGNGFLWQEEGGIFTGAPSLDEFTHVVFDSKQWLIGGTDYSSAPRRTRDVWSSADGVIWQKHRNALPTEIDRHASVVFQNKVWILGGSQGSTSASDAIYVSDNGTVWTQLASLPVGLSHAEAVVLDNAIVLLGGSLENGSVSNKVWKSTNGITWTEVGTDALAGKNFSNRSAAVFANAIWIVGNNQNDEPTTYYSEDGGAMWLSGPRPDTNVFGGTDLVVLDDTLWLVGGYDDSTPSQADVVQFLRTSPKGTCNPITFQPVYTCEEEEEEGSSSSATSLIAQSTASTASTASTTSTASTASTDGGTSGTTTGGTSGNNGGGGTTGGSDRARCGDGLKQGREACDDGNNRSRDGCSSSCEIENIQRVANAGNTSGRTGGSEETLQAIARNNGCGNGLVEPSKGEQCDDKNFINGDGCSDVCKVELQLLLRSGATCGNGLLEEEEECDTGTENSDTEKNGCRTDCTTAHCGDFVLDKNEECDNGPANSDSKENACRTDCRLFVCGDGTIDTEEECDDGNTKNGDGCSSTCSSEEALFASASVCGDGVLAYPEECNDANARGGDGCSTICQLEFGICGDGIVQELLGEQCESSLHDVSVGYACSDCQFFSTSCGDGTVDLGETCDDGKANSDTPGASCRSNCHMARCGDGIVDAEEECDDGNRVSKDGCDWNCAEESETLVLGTQIDFGEDPSLNIPNVPIPNSQFPTTASPYQQGPTSTQFPQYPHYQQLPYQLPLAQLQPLIAPQGVAGETGPAAVAVVASGMAAGLGWMRRKRK